VISSKVDSEGPAETAAVVRLPAKCRRLTHGQNAGSHNARMLKVALGPAPVAHGNVDQRRRATFV
jgi:hypothetical protein